MSFVTVYSDPELPDRIGRQLDCLLAAADLSPIGPVKVSRVINSRVALVYRSETKARRALAFVAKVMCDVCLVEPDPTGNQTWMVCFKFSEEKSCEGDDMKQATDDEEITIELDSPVGPRVLYPEDRSYEVDFVLPSGWELGEESVETGRVVHRGSETVRVWSSTLRALEDK